MRKAMGWKKLRQKKRGRRKRRNGEGEERGRGDQEISTVVRGVEREEKYIIKQEGNGKYIFLSFSSFITFFFLLHLFFQHFSKFFFNVYIFRRAIGFSGKVSPEPYRFLLKEILRMESTEMLFKRVIFSNKLFLKIQVW